MVRVPSLLVLGLCCAGGLTGQTGGGSSGSFSRVVDGVTHRISFTMKNAPPLPSGVVFTGAQYSAEEIEERVQTLADGSHLTQKRLTWRVSRDSQGRERRESGCPPAADPYSKPVAGSVRMYDAVGNVQCMLEPRNMVAHCWDMSEVPSPDTMILAPAGVSSGEGLPPSPPPRSMAADYRPAAPAAPPPGLPRPPAGAAPPNMPVMKSERLGTQVIDGLTVEGTRMTQTYPAGADGSDRPIVVVSEQWSSPELRVTVLSKTNDPRTGETTRTLIHISRDEPAISLFHPPADYRVVDEKVTVTINHQVQR